MKLKTSIIVILVIFFVLGLIYVGRASKLAGLYVVNDEALAPSHKRCSVLLASSLKNLSLHSLVVLTLPNSTYDKEYIRRIAGLEGDTLEFNDGYLLRNGYVDDKLNKVMFNYYVRKYRIKSMALFQQLGVKTEILGDTIVVHASYADYTELSRHMMLRRYYKDRKYNAIMAFDSLSRGNAAPIIVPKGHCFVLADNRDNYDDSRQWGFIPLSNIKATVISTHY